MLQFSSNAQMFVRLRLVLVIYPAKTIRPIHIKFCKVMTGTIAEKTVKLIVDGSDRVFLDF